MSKRKAEAQVISLLRNQLREYRDSVNALCNMKPSPLTPQGMPSATEEDLLRVVGNIIPLWCQSNSVLQAYMANIPLCQHGICDHPVDYSELARVTNMASGVQGTLANAFALLAARGGDDPESVLFEDAVDEHPEDHIADCNTARSQAEMISARELSPGALEPPASRPRLEESPLVEVPVEVKPLPEPVHVEKREKVPIPSDPPFGVSPKTGPEFTPYTKLEAGVLGRIKLWTSDPRKFSRNVLPSARQSPPSNAYMLGGSLTEGSSFLDSGSRRDQSRVPNPATAFRLQWHRALLHERLGEVRLPPETLDRLTKLHNAQNLLDIAALVEKNPNFLAQKERYPNLMHILSLLKDIKSA